MSAGQHRPKDDSTQFNEEETAIGLKANERMSGMSCANCGKKYNDDDYGVVITMQAAMPAHGVLSVTVKAPT